MYETIRAAIRSELKSLTKQLTKLEAVLASLGDDTTAEQSTAKQRGKTPATTKTKRLKLTGETRDDIASKVYKAVKANRDGASKADILKYLSTSGYEVGHHFNEPHLFQMLNVLRDGDKPMITTTGEKAAMRYHAA